MPNPNPNATGNLALPNATPKQWQDQIRQLGFCIFGHHTGGGCIGGGLFKGTAGRIIETVTKAIIETIIIAIIAFLLILAFPEEAIAGSAAWAAGWAIDDIAGLLIGRSVWGIIKKGITRSIFGLIREYLPDIWKFLNRPDNRDLDAPPAGVDPSKTPAPLRPSTPENNSGSGGSGSDGSGNSGNTGTGTAGTSSGPTDGTGAGNGVNTGPGTDPVGGTGVGPAGNGNAATLPPPATPTPQPKPDPRTLV